MNAGAAPCFVRVGGIAVTVVVARFVFNLIFFFLAHTLHPCCGFLDKERREQGAGRVWAGSRCRSPPSWPLIFSFLCGPELAQKKGTSMALDVVASMGHRSWDVGWSQSNRGNRREWWAGCIAGFRARPCSDTGGAARALSPAQAYLPPPRAVTRSWRLSIKTGKSFSVIRPSTFCRKNSSLLSSLTVHPCRSNGTAGEIGLFFFISPPYLFLLVIHPITSRKVDIPLLAVFLSSAKQNHQYRAVLAKINTVTRPYINNKTPNPSAYIITMSKTSPADPVQPIPDSLFSLSIP